MIKWLVKKYLNKKLDELELNMQSVEIELGCDISDDENVELLEWYTKYIEDFRTIKATIDLL